MALDGMNLGAGELLVLNGDVRVKTHDEMRQAILDKYAKTIANKNIADLTPMERAKYDAADELAKQTSVGVPTAHYFNKERAKQESVVTDRLNAKIRDAMNNTPDFKDSIAMDQGSLSKVAKFLEATDWDQYNKLTKDKAGHDRALLEIVKTAQAHGVGGKQKAINAIVDHRVTNPIDKGVGRKISDGVKGIAAKGFAAVAAVGFLLKPKAVFAKIASKKVVGLATGAVMALGAATGVDQDGGVPAISMADVGVQVSTNFDGFVANTGYEDHIMRTAIDTFVANSADATTVIAAAATIMDAASDGKINGETTAGVALVEAGEVDVNQSVMTVDHGLRMAVAEATIQEYSDLEGGEVSVADDANMAYMVQETGVSYSLDGLFGTDGVATERLQEVAEIGSIIAQNALEGLQAANEQGFTPLMTDQGQMLTQFSQNNPEIMAQIDSAETERTRGEMIMMAAYDIAEANGINMNQLTTGGVLMVPKTFDFERAYPLQEIQAQNNDARMSQFNR